MSDTRLMDIPDELTEGKPDGKRKRGAPTWQLDLGLPELVSSRLTLRELTRSDAPSLWANLSTEDVQRYIAPAPTTLEGFEVFIQWTIRERKAGRFLCYGIVPRGHDRAVGIFEAWPVEPTFRVAETRVSLGLAFWGTGLFQDSARLFLQFLFEGLSVHRVEGRAAASNLRGNAAVRKLGAVDKGLLRKCFLVRGEYADHVLWSILAEDWRRRSHGRTG